MVLKEQPEKEKGREIRSTDRHTDFVFRQLRTWRNLEETEQLPVCLDSRLTPFSEVFPFPTSCSVKKYIFLSPVEIPQLVKNQWIIYGTLMTEILFLLFKYRSKDGKPSLNIFHNNIFPLQWKLKKQPAICVWLHLQLLKMKFIKNKN